MANDADNVRVAVSGAVAYGPDGTTPPTGTSTDVTPRVEVGYIHEDGVTLSFPDQGEAEKIRAWQNSDEVRTIFTPPDESPTVQFVMIETTLAAIELWSGATVTQTTTEGQWDYDSSSLRETVDLVLTIVDGDQIVRGHIPKARVTELEDVELNATNPVGWGVTISAERDSTLGYNIRWWSTGLGSGV